MRANYGPGPLKTTSWRTSRGNSLVVIAFSYEGDCEIGREGGKESGKGGGRERARIRQWLVVVVYVVCSRYL